MDKIAIEKYMTPHPHTIGSEQSLEVAHQKLREFGTHHLPVLHGGRIAGVLTLRDLELVESLPGVSRETIKVEEAMSAEVYEVAPEADLAEVSAYMVEHRISSAIVTDNGQLRGVFTTVDALRALADTLN